MGTRRNGHNEYGWGMVSMTGWARAMQDENQGQNKRGMDVWISTPSEMELPVVTTSHAAPYPRSRWR